MQWVVAGARARMWCDREGDGIVRDQSHSQLVSDCCPLCSPLETLSDPRMPTARRSMPATRSIRSLDPPARAGARPPSPPYPLPAVY